ncbi:MAG: type I-E CRISPR-associated endoribonuclease Cas2e [Candidatus Hinthialibacter antarcticus]|nr:type I-E CRISPR-associated endoribonuclease Cas2e [Candidatus Hinthialibacter antarcticus]
MIVMILERVSPSLRGELTRWLIEPKAGVFVGRVSAKVREKLWTKVSERVKNGACMLIWRTNTEQGYKIDYRNDPSRIVTDWDGLQLITKPDKHKEKSNSPIHEITP